MTRFEDNKNKKGVDAVVQQTGNLPTFTERELDDKFAEEKQTVKEPTTPETKQDEVVTTPSNHLFKWGEEGVTLDSVMKGEGKDTPKRQILDDYLRWSHENGVPVDYFTVNDIVNGATDLKLSPVDDEAAKKKAERKERWDKVGNFLLHLGNAIGNVGGGGYASVKMEDPVQWGERQRLLKEKAEKQRVLNNQSIWNMMQKGWAEQRSYELRKQQAETNAELRKAYAEAAKQKANDNSQVAGATVMLKEAQTNQTNQLTPVKVETEKSKAEKNRKPVIRTGGRGRNGGSNANNEKVTERYDGNGNLKGSSRSYQRPRNGKGNGYSDNGNGKGKGY